MRHLQLNRLDFCAKSCLVGIFFFFPISLAAANILMALALLCWLINGNFRQRWKSVRHNPMTLPALLIYGLVLAGSLYSAAPSHDIWQHIGKYSKFLYLLLAITLLQEEKWRHRCWTAFASAMLITLASVYANIWLDLPWSNTHNDGWGVDHSVFNHHIPQELMMSFFAVMSLQHAVTEKSKLSRLIWGGIALLTMLSVTHLSIGRTGYLALFSSCLVYCIFYIRNRMRWIIAAGAVLVMALLAFTSPQMQDRIKLGVNEVKNHDKEEITSLGARVRMWELSLKEIQAHPIIGSGTGSYHALAKESFNNDAWCAIVCFHPHNQFLFFGVEYGALGILAYAFYLYRPTRFGLAQKPPLRPLLLSFLSILIIDSMTHGPMWLSVENHFFTFIMALLMATASNRATESDGTPCTPLGSKSSSSTASTPR